MGHIATEPSPLRELLDSTDDGVFILDADRRFVLFNRACERLTGFSAAEILGTGCGCVDAAQCDDQRGRTLAGRLCPGPAIFQGRLPAQPQRQHIQSRTGESRWVQTQYTALCDGHGRPRCIIGVIRSGSNGHQHQQDDHQPAEAFPNPPPPAVSTSPSTTTTAADGVIPLDQRLADIERRAILDAIHRARGQRNLAARLMGISRSRLYRRMQALGINPSAEQT